ncbi:MAG: glycogen synthase GlgA, partial [Pseudomonadota bacterium]
MLAVLFATSEAYPLVKTGGLGDISYALPRALCQAGVDVRLLLPGYPAVLKKLSLKIIHDNIKLLPHLPTMRLLEGQMLGDVNLPIYVLDCPQLFMRDGGIYQDLHGHDWHDNAQRFAALSKLAALFASHCFDFKPQIIH